MTHRRWRFKLSPQFLRSASPKSCISVSMRAVRERRENRYSRRMAAAGVAGKMRRACFCAPYKIAEESGGGGELEGSKGVRRMRFVKWRGKMRKFVGFENAMPNCVQGIAERENKPAKSFESGELEPAWILIRRRVNFRSPRYKYCSLSLWTSAVVISARWILFKETFPEGWR